jgi:hygromycin-B 4-O-kinase
MNDIQPKVDRDTVIRILAECVEGKAGKVEPLEQGQIASTFVCTIGGDQLIVQFNKPNMATSYRKELFFGRRFAEAGIPVRQVVGSGTHDGLVYTVAKKVAGRSLSDLEPAVYRNALPSVFQTLLALESLDVSDTTGYGWFDERGNAPYDSWLGHLCQVREEEPGAFYGNWHEMFERTFLDRKTFETYYEKMATICESLNVPRLLVHGGFGYDNVLVEDDKVSAVLDWQDARFGDPLMDIAYMDFWPSGFDLLDLYESFCNERGIVHSQYRERISVCKLYNGIDAMRFFAKIGNKSAYDSVVGILGKA